MMQELVVMDIPLLVREKLSRLLVVSQKTGVEYLKKQQASLNLKKRNLKASVNLREQEKILQGLKIL